MTAQRSDRRRPAAAAGRALLIAWAALTAPAGGAHADEYPSRPITLAIGSAPAGSTDIIGRVLAKSLGDTLGQPVVVLNTPGAGGSVMATELKHAVPDGYSLGMTISQAYTGNPLVTPSTGFRLGDFTHLAAVSKGQCALVTQSSSPYRTLDDLLTAARNGARPIFASQSPLTRIVADYIAKVAGVEFRVITVQGGGEMMQTILGGHADFGFSGGPHVDYVEAGQMRVLAAADSARLATSPDVPTLAELGYDVSACAMFVVSAPPGLPDDIRDTLGSALDTAIHAPPVRALIRQLKLPEFYLGPADVTRALEAESDSLSRALARIRDTGTSDEALSPAFMPRIAAALTGGALALLLIARMLGIGLGRRPGHAISWRYLTTVVAVLAVGFVLFDRAGYLIGAIAFVTGFLALARTRPAIVVGMAAGLPAALWFLFDRLLGFPLP